MIAPGESATGVISWFVAEPTRLARDRTEVAQAFPELHWIGDGPGGFDGVLPLWPFPRTRPTGLESLIGGLGLRLELRYGQGYPMVAPTIRPLDPDPSVEKWTVHDWHVNGDGTLCLLQAHALWDPGASVVDLLLKAAGWRIEYALMEAHAIDTMSVYGIVSDDSFDPLIADTAAQIGADTGPKTAAEPGTGSRSQAADAATDETGSSA